MRSAAAVSVCLSAGSSLGGKAGERGARQGFGTSYLFNTALKKANVVLGGTRGDVSLAGITAIV